jgi:hypothetical protein
VIEQFIADGFVKVEGAFPEATAQACADLLWAETGFDRDNLGTWVKPVHWVFDMAQEPFVEAANTPVLHEAFDQIAGPGHWVPRPSLGSFPLRFPHDDEPDDAGWHIEGSFLPEGGKHYRANVRSKDRALLMLFLFTEVDEDNAPTRIRVGSHMDVPPVLQPYGDAGASPLRIAKEIADASAHRPVALATGVPGDVYLCHPFLVHAAQPNHGTKPRFMGQPPLHPKAPYDLENGDSPVERTIRDALSPAR